MNNCKEMGGGWGGGGRRGVVNWEALGVGVWALSGSLEAAVRGRSRGAFEGGSRGGGGGFRGVRGCA